MTDPAFRPANHLAGLPPYVFGEIARIKMEAYAQKKDVIDLGMGNPDLPTPPHIVEALCETVRNHHSTHRYPQAKGMPKLRKAIADWYAKRFGVTLDPEREVVVLVGSKEGLAHLCMSVLNPGDVALVPSPSYPVHRNGVFLAHGEVFDLPLVAERNYMPDLAAIPGGVADRARLLILNYPNNPTGAVVESPAVLEEAVAFARRHGLVLAYDNAYSELTYDGYAAPSILQIPGAREVSVEFHSFSKTYNMAGWRMGWAVGNANILAALERFKSYLDYGVFTALQFAGVAALTGPQDCVAQQAEIYRTRRDRLVAGLNKLGWPALSPKATMYLWTRIPEPYAGLGSVEFCRRLLLETGIALAPGVGFGPVGEGYVRLALVASEQRLHDVVLRLKEFLKGGQEAAPTRKASVHP